MQELVNSVIQNIHQVEIYTNISKYHRLVGHGPWKDSRDWLIRISPTSKEFLNVQRRGQPHVWASGTVAV